MTAAWHRYPNALRRFVGDLIADEVRRLRPGIAALPTFPWDDEMPLGETHSAEGLGLDSLETMNIAAALTEALHLRDLDIERQFGRFADLLSCIASRLDQDGARLTFLTSGSSGRPKPCVHHTADLMEEVHYFEGLLAQSRRVLSAVPAHHIYGFLFTGALPARLGADVVDVRRLTPQAIAAMTQPGDLLVSHPQHWTLIARHAPRLAARVTGVTSTAPCSPMLAQELIAPAIGLDRLIQVYGSSETGGMGWRDTPETPYKLLPHWAHGSTITRRSAAGHPVAADLQDQLDWIGDREFRVLGRIDCAVQVAGVNVFPARVREELLRHPHVADAAVRLMGPGEGSCLKAFVVSRQTGGETELMLKLDRWMRLRLSAAERPKSYTVGRNLPVDSRGKLSDWSISTSATTNGCPEIPA